MFHPLAIWHYGQNCLEIEPCVHFCACGDRTELYCDICGVYTCKHHLKLMPHSTRSDFSQCITCSERDGPLYCHQCVVCTRWVPIRAYATTGGGWQPPLCRPIMTECAICGHWVCGFCGNFTVGSEFQAGKPLNWNSTVARDCGRPCTSLAGPGNFRMPEPMLKDWTHI